MDQPDLDKSFAERVQLVSTPKDLIDLHREAIEKNLRGAAPLGAAYEDAMGNNNRMAAIGTGKQIERLTAQMLEETGEIKKRIAALYQSTDAAVEASMLLEDPKERVGFINLWAHSVIENSKG